MKIAVTYKNTLKLSNQKLCPITKAWFTHFSPTNTDFQWSTGPEQDIFAVGRHGP